MKNILFCFFDVSFILVCRGLVPLIRLRHGRKLNGQQWIARNKITSLYFTRTLHALPLILVVTFAVTRGKVPNVMRSHDAVIKSLLEVHVTVGYHRSSHDHQRSRHTPLPTRHCHPNDSYRTTHSTSAACDEGQTTSDDEREGFPPKRDSTMPARAHSLFTITLSKTLLRVFVGFAIV